MKKSPADMSWLPPKEEWDFRTVTEQECRIVCYWEYKREFHLQIDAERQVTNTAPVVDPARQLSQVEIPKPEKTKAWLSLTIDERAVAKAANTPPPIVQVRTFEEFMDRVPVSAKDDPNVWSQYTQGVYVIRPDFAAGVESVMHILQQWARKEAKKFTQSPRAKAAAEPFHLLKWLAAYRLNQRGKAAGLKYKDIHRSLIEYQNRNRMPSEGDVFPGNYVGQGAWSKACRDAHRTGILVERDPRVLLRNVSKKAEKH